MITPVVYLVFNRPDVTARTFEAIRQARPRQLLIVADGPRPSRPGEAERCAEVRRIAEAVDWPCEVKRDYAETNMGCGRRLSSGISWAFEQAEEAIFLEDDCLPDQSFFPFCEELLARYRNNERVMVISGDNFHGGRQRGTADYFFSRYHHIWGWASWRRAWRHFDFTMSRWPELRRQNWLKTMVPGRAMRDYWQNTFDAVAAGRIDTWDYQWMFSCWTDGGLAISPNVNLVSNLGFRQDATHTTRVNKHYLPPLGRVAFPLRHPDTIAPCPAADRYEERTLYLPWLLRLKIALKSLLVR